ncbi:methionine ABC transporter ATP-binding protein MetN [Flavobacterium aquidurense]|jgi:D-methionine transport system ATP-binding protein|uniref:methionine ABC transporter ATP-binding protein MetN n=1 Tax=Flavobacterium aquidurense TaxID=362413 RepID=UPI000922A959|nr:methionine ABC transporter ATP-binding protein MetN [Flavobacterium aquidurense]OXA69834.1 D-methionine ABC transporter, ATP-binding protein [Flavobacterium aquidurense]SHG53908.1 D-methionine transport system ATP-binding protein [Flavobacterium frigidimaris]
MIELKNVTKNFHQKNRIVSALSDVSLKVPPGKIFGVIGTSGAGKSTLIRCVNLLERPTSGEIIVDGKLLMRLSNAQLAIERRQIGMIFQHFNLLSSRTVFENVAFPLELVGGSKTDIRTRVLELLELVGLAEKANDYPASLSGGQKQRVAIARTLANNPKVLLCDEATSALDPATTRSILNLLKDINRRLNITILLITHQMEVVKSICDEVAVISHGKLIEQGSVGEIFADPKHALTKEFIASSLHLDIPRVYQERLQKEDGEGLSPLLRLEMTGKSVNEPVISEVSRLFDTNFKIVSAQMDQAGDVNFGVMLIELSGKRENYEAAIEYFISKHIKTEIIGYV